MPQNVVGFRRSLLRWYRHHGRDLPWRKTRDPYAVLVSEFMLQQTQVASAAPYYIEWLRRFPDFKALTRASENEVLNAWQGLGYYARARNLHASAKIIVDRHGGNFPREISQMRELPGVGRYTANAVATFALERPVPIVEANTARVLARLFNINVAIDSANGRERLWSSAARLLPRRASRAFNSALMDLGALVCRPQPRCAICPLKTFCRATHPERLPVKKPRLRTQHLTETHALALKQNQILLEQSSGRWRGMWILPLVAKRTSKPPLHVSIFPFTNHRVTLRVFSNPTRKIDNRRQRWFAIDALASVPIPSPHRRALNAMLQ